MLPIYTLSLNLQPNFLCRSVNYTKLHFFTLSWYRKVHLPLGFSDGKAMGKKGQQYKDDKVKQNYESAK